MKAFVSTVVALLTLAVGAVHLSLEWVVFRGRFFGGAPAPVRPGAPPGGPPSPLPVPFIGHSLPALFLANFVAAVVLAILFLVALRLAYGYRLGMDVLLIAFAGATLIGWNNLHRPNPRGLGYTAAALEVALILFAILHMVVSQTRATPAQTGGERVAPATPAIREQVRGEERADVS